MEQLARYITEHLLKLHCIQCDSFLAVKMPLPIVFLNSGYYLFQSFLLLSCLLTNINVQIIFTVFCTTQNLEEVPAPI